MAEKLIWILAVVEAVLGCRAKFRFNFPAIGLKIFLAGFSEKLAFNMNFYMQGKKTTEGPSKNFNFGWHILWMVPLTIVITITPKFISATFEIAIFIHFRWTPKFVIIYLCAFIINLIFIFKRKYTGHSFLCVTFCKQIKKVWKSFSNNHHVANMF